MYATRDFQMSLPKEQTMQYRSISFMDTEDMTEHEQQVLSYCAAKDSAKLMWQLGIPMHVRGYHYLLDAVSIALQMPEMSINLSQQLYPCIALHYHTSASCVERSIRNAIELAWKRGALSQANGMFGRSLNLAYEKPTNSEMIALLTETVRLHLFELTTHE